MKGKVYRDGRYRVDIQYSGAWEMYTWGGNVELESPGCWNENKQIGVFWGGGGIRKLEE